MQAIRYMKFTCQHSSPFYMVGTSIEAMRRTAQNVDRGADPLGEEVNSERVIADIRTDQQRDFFEEGVRAAKSGSTDFYLFSC